MEAGHDDAVDGGPATTGRSPDRSRRRRRVPGAAASVALAFFVGAGGALVAGAIGERTDGAEVTSTVGALTSAAAIDRPVSGAVVAAPTSVLSIQDDTGMSLPVPDDPEGLPVVPGDRFVVVDTGVVVGDTAAEGVGITCGADEPAGPGGVVPVAAATTTPVAAPVASAYCSLLPPTPVVGIRFADLTVGDPAGPVPVAIRSPWDPVPRHVDDTTVERASGDGRAALWRLLDDAGIDTAGLSVRRALRADLDGDGRVEEVVALESLPTWPAIADGDRALVVLVDAAGARLVTSEAREVGAVGIVHRHDLSGLVDTDGDGRLEVIVSMRHATGYALATWRMRPDGRLMVAGTAGCSS